IVAESQRRGQAPAQQGIIGPDGLFLADAIGLDTALVVDDVGIAESGAVANPGGCLGTPAGLAGDGIYHGHIALVAGHLHFPGFVHLDGSVDVDEPLDYRATSRNRNALLPTQGAIVRGDRHHRAVGHGSNDEILDNQRGTRTAQTQGGNVVFVNPAFSPALRIQSGQFAIDRLYNHDASVRRRRRQHLAADFGTPQLPAIVLRKGQYLRIFRADQYQTVGSAYRAGNDFIRALAPHNSSTFRVDREHITVIGRSKEAGTVDSRPQQVVFVSLPVTN